MGISLKEKGSHENYDPSSYEKMYRPEERISFPERQGKSFLILMHLKRKMKVHWQKRDSIFLHNGAKNTEL